MYHELCIPLTTKIMALGHPLHAAQCLAAVITFQVVLIYTVTGYRIAGPEKMGRPAFSVILACEDRSGVVRMCGIFPALTGTAADTSRALPFTQ
jgi:hypothetical protein